MSVQASPEMCVDVSGSPDNGVRMTWQMLGNILMAAAESDTPATYIRDVQAWNGVEGWPPSYTCVVSWSTARRGPDGAALVYRQPWDIAPGMQGPPFRETAIPAVE